jgi:hypothetical protein
MKQEYKVMNFKMVIVTFMLTDDQLARQGSSFPFVGPEPALGISAKVASRVIRGWMSRKHEEYSWSSCGQIQTKVLLKRPSAKEAV